MKKKAVIVRARERERQSDLQSISGTLALHEVVVEVIDQGLGEVARGLTQVPSNVPVVPSCWGTDGENERYCRFQEDYGGRIMPRYLNARNPTIETCSVPGFKMHI